MKSPELLPVPGDIGRSEPAEGTLSSQFTEPKQNELESPKAHHGTVVWVLRRDHWTIPDEASGSLKRRGALKSKTFVDLIRAAFVEPGPTVLRGHLNSVYSMPEPFFHADTSKNNLIAPSVESREFRATLQRLLQERDEDKKALAELQAQVDQLQAQVEALCAERQAPLPLQPLVEDPYELWIENHLEELEKYPDSYVAIDLERGVVLHELDEDAFGRRLGELFEREPEARTRLLTTHTSLYVQGRTDEG